MWGSREIDVFIEMLWREVKFLMKWIYSTQLDPLNIRWHLATLQSIISAYYLAIPSPSKKMDENEIKLDPEDDRGGG